MNRHIPTPEAAVTRLTRRLGDVLRANAELTFLVCVFAASLVLAFATRGMAWT